MKSGITGKELLLSLIIMVFFFSCDYEKKTKINMDNTIRITSVDSLSNEVYEIGVATMLSPKKALPAYEEIVNYIGEKLNIRTKMLFTKDYSSMNELVKTKKVLAAFVCSGPYVSQHDDWGMEIIAAPTLYGNSVYYSYIIVNKESGVNKFEDLKGKRFAFTDPISNTGKLVPTYELAKLNTTPELFFSDIIYSGSHDKSIEAVASNLVDGAAVDHLIWEYINKSDSAYTSKTKIIKKLGPFCIPPFVTYPDCDSTLKQNMRAILLNMHNDPKGKKILDQLYIDEFVLVQDDCYQSIREMNEWIKKTEMSEVDAKPEN